MWKNVTKNYTKHVQNRNLTKRNDLIENKIKCNMMIIIVIPGNNTIYI